MKKVISVFGFAAVVLFASQAMAQEKVTEINFEGDTIEGDLMMPTQSNIAVKELDELSSLIRAREDFVDEMRKTVDELEVDAIDNGAISKKRKFDDEI